MRIVVTTPTGNVGSHVLRMLVRGGVRPVALARDPDRLPPEVRGHVEPVAADQADLAAVVRATAGADRLFWVNPPAPPGADPAARHAGYARVVAEAVRVNGIGATVFQSSVGAELRHGAGDIDGLGATEQALDDVATATGAAVLHLRCGYFMTNLLMSVTGIAQGTLATPWPLEHPLPWVAPRDIAEVAALRLLGPRWTGRSVQAVHGPEDLTFTRVAQVLTAVCRPPVRATHLPERDHRTMHADAGLTPAEVDAVDGMARGLVGGFVPEQRRAVSTTTPTTLRSWAAEHLVTAAA